MENSNIAYENSHPHYALVSEGINKSIKEAYREAYNIDFIEFPTGDYNRANEMLNELQLLVTERRQVNPA